MQLPTSRRHNTAPGDRVPTVPVLGIDGVDGWGGMSHDTPRGTRSTDSIYPGRGHWVGKQNPAGVLDALAGFLASYRAAV